MFALYQPSPVFGSDFSAGLFAVKTHESVKTALKINQYLLILQIFYIFYAAPR